MTRRVTGIAAAMLAASALLPTGSPCAAATQAILPSALALHAGHVDAAAQRFGIPAQWIWAVMQQESGGDTGAVSHAGAMGLMQIMPTTWQILRARLSLGSDPFDPRDNIVAGTAYLRDMFDRYGAGGMLAAYNAGPGRYEDYLRSGRPLPAETRAYLSRLSPRIGAATAQPLQQIARPPANAWTQARLFPAGVSVTGTGRKSAGEPAFSTTPPGSSSLFIARTDQQP